MGEYGNSIIIVLLFTLITFVYSQVKFKNKMLCTFLRPNKMRIKKFVPLYSRHVIFDRNKYGVERYRVDPKCIVLEWYTAGINKMFPVLIPTLDFEWWSPNPRDPTTGKIEWHSPEVEAAGYQGQSYVGLARAMSAQAGMKRNKIMELLPIVAIGLIVIVIYLLYTFNVDMSHQIAALQNAKK